MGIHRTNGIVGLLLCVALLGSCGGGGTKLSISSINVNPAAPSAGSVVELTASLTGSNTAGLTRNWNVDLGTLTTTPPDFSLLLREVAAKGASASSVSTTNNVVYWVTPTTAGTATVSLTVEGATKSRTVTLGAQAVTLSVSDGTGGDKICTISASNISDLYQAAFRVNFSSAWRAKGADPGDFLGAESDVVFFYLLDQNGFVPVAISRKGTAAGVDGSGVLATLTFGSASVAGVHGASAAEVPFDIGVAVLRNSADELIN